MNLWGIGISNLPAKAVFNDEKHADALRVVSSIIIAFLAIVGFLGMLLKEAVDMRAVFSNPFGTIVFAAIALMSYTLLTRTATGGRVVRYSLLLALFYAVCLVIGTSICSGGHSGLTDISTWVTIVFLVPLLTLLASWLITSVEKVSSAPDPRTLRSPKMLFAIWGIMLLAWLPYLLASWPGVWGYDTIWQTQFLITDAQISAHHPVAHTLWMAIPMQISMELVGSYLPGVIVHVITQMIALSGLLSYIVYRIACWGVPRLVPAFIFVFFCLFVGIANYSVVMTKDVLFAGLFGVAVLMLVEIAFCPEEYFSRNPLRRSIALAVVLVAAFLFRNNCVYAALIALPFCLFLLPAVRKRILAIFLLSIVSYFLIIGPISEAAGVYPGNKREMMSVPSSQLALTMMESENLSEEDMNFIATYVPDWKKYDPYKADSVKNTFNINAVMSDPLEFASKYLSIGAEHPDLYLNAWLRLSVGYWNPATDYSNSNKYQNLMMPYFPDSREPSDAYPADKYIFIDQQPVIPALHDVLEGAASSRIELAIPGLSFVCQAGTWIWVAVFFLAYCMYRRNYGALIPAIFVLAYLFSVLLGPLSNYRYAFPFFISGAVLLAALFAIDEGRNTSKRGFHAVRRSRHEQR